MTLYAGHALYAADVAIEEARCYSTGVNLVTVASGGAESPMTFDTITNPGTPDITIQGANNTQYVFNTDAEYTVGFNLRFNLAASATQNDLYAYIRLNNNIELFGMTVKPVLSVASVLTYQAWGGGIRHFGVGDYIEVRLRNSTNVSATESNVNESTVFYAKRTVG